MPFCLIPKVFNAVNVIFLFSKILRVVDTQMLDPVLKHGVNYTALRKTCERIMSVKLNSGCLYQSHFPAVVSSCQARFGDFSQKITTFPHNMPPSHDIGALPQCTHTGFGHRKPTKRPILYTKFRSPIQNAARAGKTLKYATLSCTEASVTAYSRINLYSSSAST